MISIEWYRAINKLYFDILEAVFGDYRTNDKYIIPDIWLNLTFTSVLGMLKDGQEYYFKKYLPYFNFDDYINFKVNYDYMIKNYPNYFSSS